MRLKTSVVVPGFAQLTIATAGGQATDWGGQFFAREDARISEGGAAELLLPGGLVGRVVIDAVAEGRAVVAGKVPWSEWPRLMEGGYELTEPRLTQHDGYFEARGPSAITPENWVNISEVPFEAGTKLLLDYRPVERITVPFDWFLGAGQELERLGQKVAVVATSPMAFGNSRQTILTAGLDEERQFGVFREYEEARAWLLAGGERRADGPD